MLKPQDFNPWNFSNMKRFEITKSTSFLQLLIASKNALRKQCYGIGDDASEFWGLNAKIAKEFKRRMNG